jgi:hypothetical protein
MLQGDALPAGAISFFDADACPYGWDAFGPGAHRFALPTVGSAPPLATRGDALAAGEDRTHGHAITASATLTGVSYAGIAGEANHGVAAEQVVAIAAPADPVSSGLPDIQLLVCKKSVEPPAAAAAIPRGLLLFWDGPVCPDGFAQPIATQGRLLVGLPEGATSGLSFGGNALDAAEDRTHVHDVGGDFATSPHGIALASGCCADGYGADGQYAYSGVTDATPVDLPTIDLLQCEKL